MRQYKEPDVIACFCRHVKPWMIVVDVGADIGYHSLILSRLAKQVIAYEPDNPFLEGNIKRNSQNVEIVRSAVSTAPGKARFFRANKKGTGSMFYENMHGGEWIDIETVSIDYPINFFKIDVEGAELEVLEGMKHRCSGVLEMSYPILEAREIDPFQFLQKLRGYGFTILLAEDEHYRTDEELVNLARKKKHINLFCKYG